MTTSLPGALIPHGSLHLTGPLSASSLAWLNTENWPDLFIVLGTSHHTSQPSILFQDFQTPIGKIYTDPFFIRRFLNKANLCGLNCFDLNPENASHEHSWQINLPLLETLAWKLKRPLSLVAILMGNSSWSQGLKMGTLLQETAKEQNKSAFLVASGDLTHYGTGFPWKLSPPARPKTLRSVSKSIENFDRPALNAISGKCFSQFKKIQSKSSFCATSQVAALLRFTNSKGSLLSYGQFLSGELSIWPHPPSRKWNQNSDWIFSAASFGFFSLSPKLQKKLKYAICQNIKLTKKTNSVLEFTHLCFRPQKIKLKWPLSDVCEVFYKNPDVNPLEFAKILSKHWKSEVSEEKIAFFLEQLYQHGVLHPKQNMSITPLELEKKYTNFISLIPYYNSYPRHFKNAPILNSSIVKKHWSEFTHPDQVHLLKKGRSFKTTSSGSSQRERIETHVEFAVEDKRCFFTSLVNSDFSSPVKKLWVNRPENVGLDWNSDLGLLSRRYKHLIKVTPGPDPSAVKDKDWDQILKLLDSKKGIDVLAGDPAYLAGLARRALTHGISLDHLAWIETTHNYTWSIYKKPIQTAFSSPLFDIFATSEFAQMAVPCKLGTSHLIEKGRYYEIVRKGKNVKEGELGTLLVTTLDTNLRPLIRYSTGDLFRLLPQCPCGSPFRSVLYEGRLQHLIPGKQKPFLTYQDLDRVLDDSDSIQHFRLKEKVDLFELEIIPTSKHLLNQDLLENSISRLLKKKVRVRLKRSLGVKVGKVQAVLPLNRSQLWNSALLGTQPK